VDTQNTGNDRRKYERFAIDYPISYALKNRDDIATGMAVNLSEGGLLAYCFERILVGSELDLEMFYAFELQFTSLNAEAKIVWKDIVETGESIEYQYGIEFTRMDETEKDRLHRLLASIDDAGCYAPKGHAYR
jgi:c-di-GMP-binding flagellar brake protein YcgR